MRARLQGYTVGLRRPINQPMDDLAQYSPLRRPTRCVDDEPFRFKTPIVFELVPPVPLERDRRPDDQPELRLRRFEPVR